MKKIMVGIAMVFLMTTVASAAGVRDNCGCGLGTMVFKNNSGDSVLIQVVASLLNGICGNQTFGVTSGTLECQKPAKFVRNEIMDKYVSENMDNLAVDIAAGEGESLDALVEIAGIDSEKKATFCSALQSNFDNIFMSETVTHTTVVQKINTIIETI